MKTTRNTLATMLLSVMAVLVLAGCPAGPEYPQPDPTVPPIYEGEAPAPPVPPVPPAPARTYEQGFAHGFAEDAEYWLGYDDSYWTVPDGPLLYSGSEIPQVEYPDYDAGYWDGVWYAYNDGYFVSYDYGFTIGFSEGYDLAFYPDWYSYLLGDEHPEYLDGSFADGYNDGFSEGRVFGAVDYMTGLPFDWMDAMWDYRDGTDLYIEELDLGTGEYGPVYLYEYGVDPAIYWSKTGDVPRGQSLIRRGRDGAEKTGAASPRAAYAVKAQTEKATPEEDSHELSYRTLTSEATTQLRVTPERADRSERPLTLTTSWLERVNAYRTQR